MNKEKIIYGYTPSLKIFEGKSLKEQVEILRELGTTGVFGGNTDKEFIALMHRAGMKVYCSFSCFKGKDVWEEFPEARPVEDNMNLLEQEGYYFGVNPAYEPYRRQLLQKFEQVINDCDIDGIWLDFIRWPCHWEVKDTYLPKTSFDEYTTNRFEKECDIRLKCKDQQSKTKEILMEYSEEWIAWRCDIINSWVKEARNIIRRSGKNITLGMFTVPWTEKDKDNAIINIIGQDFKGLSPYVDIFSPMVYHKMCHKNVEWIYDITNWMKSNFSSKVLPIIQSIDTPNKLELEDYERALNLLLGKEELDGLMIFNLQGITDNEERIKVTRTAFKDSNK